MVPPTKLLHTQQVCYMLDKFIEAKITKIGQSSILMIGNMMRAQTKQLFTSSSGEQELKQQMI